MRKEVIQFMINSYRESKEKDKKLIGKKTSDIKINNFLFLPSDEFRNLLMNTNNLDKEVFDTIVKISEQRFKIIESYIKTLCEEIPIIIDDKQIENKMIMTFFSNKYLSDCIASVKNYLNKEFILSPFDWAYHEFVLPFFLVNIMNEERAKAIRYMKELNDEIRQLKIQPLKKIDQRAELISKIAKTKNFLKKKTPEKKIFISDVARELGIKDSTFRGRLKDQKIIFKNI